MKLNKKIKSEKVRLAAGSGAVADKISNLQQLYRSVLACMLWEDIAYEDGQSVAQRIQSLVPKCNPGGVYSLACYARTSGKLRHVPLLLAREMARHDSHKHLVADTLYEIIQRPDELCEALKIYWKDGKTPIANSFKKGLARAFTKFDEYSLAKYSRDGEIKLRDILFLSHAKPLDLKQAHLWKRLIDNKLETPDTWEVAISAAKGEVEKRQAWERLLKENKLGALALLRNLRNFEELKVDNELIKSALNNCKAERVLPFRFISAAKYAPRWEAELEQLMFKAIEGKKVFKNKTVVILDVSGSTGALVSAKSAISRFDAEVSIAMLLREICEEVVFYATAGNDYARTHKTEVMRPRRGFGLKDEASKIQKSLGGGGIFLKQCMNHVLELEKRAERVIVITDSQDMDVDVNPNSVNAWGKKNYLIDVSCEKHGIAYGKFHQINGFSESVVDYLVAVEQAEDSGSFPWE